MDRLLGFNAGGFDIGGGGGMDCLQRVVILDFRSLTSLPKLFYPESMCVFEARDEGEMWFGKASYNMIFGLDRLVSAVPNDSDLGGFQSN
jgi:hypothetical protein